MTSWFFEAFFAAAILLNSVWIGVEVNFGGELEDSAATKMSFQVITCTFTFCFFSELVIRLVAEGGAFFCGPNVLWNVLDTVVVSVALIELGLDIVSNISGQSSLTTLRILRIVRITRLIRILRVARIIRFVRALRTLVHSIASTRTRLVWALTLLGLIIYVFAIVFTQGTQDALLNEDHQLSAEDVAAIEEYWSSVPVSMFTLFKAISNGVSWDAVVRPLGSITAFWAFVFTFYVVFSVFAVLNVMTGVFCQSAIESAAWDQELVVQAHIQNRSSYIDRAKQLFRKIDDDDSGAITFQELEAGLADPKVQTWLESLGVDLNDAWTLFKLMDHDQLHLIDIGKFVAGCLRLNGPARSVDLAVLMFEHRWLMDRFLLIMEEAHGWKSESQRDVRRINHSVRDPARDGSVWNSGTDELSE
jgi:hypothetical protein